MTMDKNDHKSLHDKKHTIDLVTSSFTEEKCVNININEFFSSLQIKVKDPNKYCFNYSAQIDPLAFDLIKKQQCLDINYSEFKVHLLEMLNQTLSGEMYLKCELDNNCKCKLVFYGKSKIKHLVFLVIELSLTNQEEIFEEMSSHILFLQESNKVLNSQLQVSRLHQQEYEGHINKLKAYNQKLSAEIFNQLQRIERYIPNLISAFTTKIGKELLNLEKKLNRLRSDVEVVKKESVLKSASSARLLESMENMRLESIENAQVISQLKKENATLHCAKNTSERAATELRHGFNEKERLVMDLQKQIDVLKKDLQDATIIIAQKTSTHDELAKDLVQANQMLVNFNNHYDMKVKEFEDLQAIALNKDKIIKEQASKFTELMREYQEYKASFNPVKEQKLNQELFAANKKIEELEKQNREAAKLNGLLTRKLSAGSLINFDKM